MTKTTTLTAGTYLNTDGIRLDLDGAGLAAYLTAAGYTVLHHWDAGSNGWVVLSNGLQVSTNGWTCIAGADKRSH